MENLEPVVSTAIAKMFKAEKLEPGTYPLDGIKVTLTLGGTMTKNEPEMRVPTTSISILTVLALTLQKSGIQAERIKDIVKAAMTEAVNMGESSKNAIEPYIKDIEKWEKEVKETLAELPKVQVEGKLLTKGVTVKMEVEVGEVPVTVNDKTTSTAPAAKTKKPKVTA